MFRIRELAIIAELNKGKDLDETSAALEVGLDEIEEAKARTTERSQQYWIEGSKGRIRINEVSGGRIQFTLLDHITGTERERISRRPAFNLTYTITVK